MRLDGFQRVALLTTAATYALIAVGGLVRAAGAGLGCPDWPKCFGRWVPPLSAADVPPSIDPALFNFAKAWTEYTNRLLGVTVGILIFATLVLAIAHHRRSRRILVATVLAFLLVALEGGIGGKVVSSQLAPVVLTIHLVFALLIVSLLLYATVCAFFPGGRPLSTLTPQRILLGRLALFTTLVTLAQIGVGAMLRGELQVIAKEHAELDRSLWLAQIGVVQAVHKGAAPLVALVVLALAGYVLERADPDPWLRRTALTSIALVFLQGLVGLGLASFALPPVLQVLHLWIGALLLGALTVLVLLAYRLDPRQAARA
jgi:cytochrome c oxidase assembly protein subunit 15